MITGRRPLFTHYDTTPSPTAIASKIGWLCIIQPYTHLADNPDEQSIVTAFRDGEIVAVIQVAGELKPEAVEVNTPSGKRIVYYEYVGSFTSNQSVENFAFFEMLNGLPDKFSCLFITKEYLALYARNADGTFVRCQHEWVIENDSNETSAIKVQGKVRFKTLRLGQTFALPILHYVSFDSYVDNEYAGDWVEDGYV